MPKRTDIQSILVIGSGPIVIGQACEFDYSGTQACKVLREEGYRIILLNSNPATIMTDPEVAHRTYIEPITVEFIEKIIQKEKPDAILPTLGGQTALNVAFNAMEQGILERYGVQSLGVNYDSIFKAEDREEFAKAMSRIGLKMADAEYISSFDEAVNFVEKHNYPVVIRPSFTLGGLGGGVVHDFDEFKLKIEQGLRDSPINKVLLEKSVLGWKEFELEVMRDKQDNVVIICSIENVDPMGVHTGDSITVAPAQTLTDSQYQEMRDAAIRIIREIGVETGGCNIQFAVNPEDGELLVIEMNPRVSRSSALASKATGFPIAKIAAKLAIGYTLDEIPNDITRETPACFEPSIDYCVIKFPRFAFEKFQEADPTLTTKMHSVGEAMAIGRTFKEALQKGLRSLEIKLFGFRHTKIEQQKLSKSEFHKRIQAPSAERLFYVKKAMLEGYSLDDIYGLCKIDRWFLNNLWELCSFEKRLERMAAETNNNIDKLDGPLLLETKQMGFSDRTLADIFQTDEQAIRQHREAHRVLPVYKLVDTCAAEFESYTPYFYSTYDEEDEIRYQDTRKVIILGGGPNRIGQGIEFDYCCVHASLTLKEMGIDSIMINSNPETVSTDYDTSTKLFFEPLTYEDVRNIIDREQPEGVIIQLGGQTPLNLALALYRDGVPILGTSPESIDMVEDRDKFRNLIVKLGLNQPASGSAYTPRGALDLAEWIGYPLMVRPSYVLGGRAMRQVYDDDDLLNFFKEAMEINPEHPILVDKFLLDAVEVDVDAVSDGETCIIAGIMEHIEKAGIHSGDSACSIPHFSLSPEIERQIREWTKQLAMELKVVGLMNIQYAVVQETLYILEVNPRASRTVPFVSKATGIPWAKIATRVMCGENLAEMDIREPTYFDYYSIKEAVLPFNRFPEIMLGPEMKSTGETMGIASDFGIAFMKSQLSLHQRFVQNGSIFVSVARIYREQLLPALHQLHELGFKLYATKGTAQMMKKHGLEPVLLKKVQEGSLHVMDLLQEGKIDYVINVPSPSKRVLLAEKEIRSLANRMGVPVITTIEGALAFISGLEFYTNNQLDVKPLQDWYQR